MELGRVEGSHGRGRLPKQWIKTMETAALQLHAGGGEPAGGAGTPAHGPVAGVPGARPPALRLVFALVKRGQ